MADNILEAMRTRRSVRTFDPRPIPDDIIQSLEKFVAEVSSPFAPAAVTIRIADIDASADFHPGTYGVIKNARTYLVMGIGSTENDELAAGFMMEQVVLRARELGLGTCWLGGTVRTSTFRQAIPADRRVRIVVPVGFPAGTRFFERVMRRVAGSDGRKPFDSLFFVNDFSTSLEPASRYGESLSMMRLAPSASNGQPWRALVDASAEAVHFFSRSGSFSNIDMGIGLCHFMLAEQALGFEGQLFRATDIPDVPAGLRYIRSYRRFDRLT